MEEATCVSGLDHNKIIEAIDHLLSTNYDKYSNKNKFGKRLLLQKCF